jgi:hypothetical protein
MELGGVSGPLNVEGVVTAILVLLDALPDDAARVTVLENVLKNRCRKCFDYDPSGQFWCCYHSRGG